MTTSVRLLHAGYVRDDGHVAGSVTLIRDGDALIVADPGLVAKCGHILDPLAALGVAPEAVTHVFLSHHHPDHTVNIALFPNEESSISGRATGTTCGWATMAMGMRSPRGRASG